GKILQLGPNREILNGYDCDHIIDAELKSVYPGFYDGHCHFQSYANQRVNVDMYGAKSFVEVVERVIAYEKSNDQPFITGRGWDQTLWEVDDFPTNDTFNILFPDKPMILRRVDGHAALANQKALDNAGVTGDTKIEGGEIHLRNGKPTGLLLDNAFGLVAQFLPTVSKEQQLINLQEAEYYLFEAGLTTINDAGISSSDRDNMIEWYKNGDLTIKNYAMLYPDDDNLKFARDNGVFRAGNLLIRSFKLVADGAMGSWGACLTAPYSDSTHLSGFMLRDPQVYKEIAELARELDYQVNTHCIGDSANRTLLKIYAEVIGDKFDHRWRIEHAQHLDPADFKFFSENSIVPSIQPTHCTSDMRWAEQRLGPERVKYAYAYQSLLDQAGRVVLGTDFPIENISPLETFYAAISRKDKEGKPDGGFYPDEALSREDALRGMTIWAAWSNFEENEKGSLEAGKAADFIILTKNIMLIDEKDILTTFVERTFLDGIEVYYSE
ncbi:amidohydrolase, partial [bacterium AH-315-C20]|nr:amidohydrolase [bacterium AH-315-C20]